MTVDRRDNYTPGWKYNFWELRVRGLACSHVLGLLPCAGPAPMCSAGFPVHADPCLPRAHRLLCSSCLQGMPLPLPWA